MKWKFWKRSRNGFNPNTVEALRSQVVTLVRERDQALNDARKRSSSLTMTRVGRVNVDPALWTANMRRIVPSMKVEMIGYELVFLAKEVIPEEQFRAIEAMCPFTIDRT